MSKHYLIKETQIYKIIEIEKNELQKIINELDLIVIKNSFFVKIKEFEIFIRKEDFKYTIIIDKNINNISKELFEIFDFPGSYYEDEKFVYYKGVYKEKLQDWVKNVA